MLDVQLAVGFLKSFPDWFNVMVIGATPIFELRGSLPVALTYYQMKWFPALFFSVIGNMIPSVLLVLYLGRVAGILSQRSKFFKKFFDWLFERTRKRAQEKVEKYGYLGLFLLVAIPLPMTGAWTGSVAVFLFGMKPRRAIFTIFCGVVTAGIIVSMLTFGVIKL